MNMRSQIEYQYEVWVEVQVVKNHNVKHFIKGALTREDLAWPCHADDSQVGGATRIRNGLILTLTLIKLNPERFIMKTGQIVPQQM